jgi:hypothetical protein
MPFEFYRSLRSLSSPACKNPTHCTAGLSDGIFAYQKSHFGIIWKELECKHFLVYFMTFLYFCGHWVIFCCHLVDFSRFDMLNQEKLGNPAALHFSCCDSSGTSSLHCKTWWTPMAIFMALHCQTPNL